MAYRVRGSYSNNGLLRWRIDTCSKNPGPGQVLQCRANQFASATKDTTNWLAHIPEHIAWTLLSILLPGRVQ